jgi:hypothetical protein
MAKAMSIAGMVVAGLLLFAFCLDIALGIPFGGQQMIMDIGFVVCAGILGYLSWDALKESK